MQEVLLAEMPMKTKGGSRWGRQGEREKTGLTPVKGEKDGKTG